MTCIIVKEFEEGGQICVEVHGIGERDGAQLRIKSGESGGILVANEDSDPRRLVAPRGSKLPTSKILSHLIELKFCIVSQSSVGFIGNYEKTVTIWTLVKNT